MSKVSHAERHLSAAIGELVDLKRDLLMGSSEKGPVDGKAIEQLLALAPRIGSMWQGPGAVDEIRNQRDKG